MLVWEGRNCPLLRTTVWQQCDCMTTALGWLGLVGLYPLPTEAD